MHELSYILYKLIIDTRLKFFTLRFVCHNLERYYNKVLLFIDKKIAYGPKYLKATVCTWFSIWVLGMLEIR